MKTFKHSICILLSLLMLLSVCAASPFAVQAAETSDAVGATYSGNTYGCRWELDTETGLMTISARAGTNGMMEDYLSDNQPWAAYARYITAVVIRDDVKNIGEYAFFGMNKIWSVRIGSSVKTIGYAAFKGCNLGKVTIPDSVETIDNYAFDNNSFMLSVTIPATVTYVGTKAFGYVDNKPRTGFKIIGYKNTAAERYAISNDFEFDEISPHSGITGSCTWKFDPETGVLTIGSSGAMADYDYDKSTHATTAPWSGFANQITKVVIGNSVTAVGDDAFMGCENLTSATLGDNLKSIGKSAFYMCNLSEITIPDTVETIGNSAFRYNKHLKTATLGSQLKTIGVYAFANCALTEVVIPDRVTEIDLYAFADTPLTKAMIPASVKTIFARAFGYSGDDPVEDFTIYGYSGTAAETYAVENRFDFFECGGVTGDCEWSFDPVTGVMTVSGNGEMGDYVNPFDDESKGDLPPWWDFNHEITAVVIGDGVTYVGEYAFFLANTESLTLGKKVVSIGKSAFYGNELTEVVIPDSVEIIDEVAFSNNQDLTDVTFGRNLQFICGTAFSSCDLRSVVFPDSLLQIRDFAFFNNNNLSSVKFGENLDYIGEQAFLNCGLREVEIPESVTWLDYCSLGCNYYESQMYRMGDFTIRGYSGTSAEDYAKAYGFTFIPIGGTIVYGDVNGDGSVTIDDATLVQKAVAELVSLDDTQKKAADVNGDGDVTIDDATTIQKYVAEIIDRFPVHALLG